MRITEHRLEKSGEEYIHVDTESLLYHEFVDDAGNRFRVNFSNGRLEISTVDGRLLVIPQAGNAIRVSAERL